MDVLPGLSAALSMVSVMPRFVQIFSSISDLYPLQSGWLAGEFRDCNGESNGISLPLDVILNEALCDDEDDYDEDNNQTTENVLVVIRALIRNINIYSIF